MFSMETGEKLEQLAVVQRDYLLDISTCSY